MQDRSTIEVEAATVTTRDSGVLWLLREVDPTRPAETRLEPVLILPRGKWHAVYPAGTDPLRDASDTEPSTEPAAPSRLLAQATVPDPLSRSAIVAAKVRLLGPQAADEM